MCRHLGRMAILALLLGGSVCIGYEVNTSLTDLVISQTGAYSRVSVRADGVQTSMEPGKPMLPSRDILVLLPAGAKAKSITYEVDNVFDVPGVFELAPAGQPDPNTGIILPVPADPSTYRSTTGLRPDAVQLLGTEVLRGYHLARVRLFPLDYIPAQGRLLLRRNIHFDIVLDTRDAVLSSFNHSVPRYRYPAPMFDRLMQRLVSNPQEATELTSVYRGETQLQGADRDIVEYLLIGRPEFFDAFQPLLDWKTRKGVPAEAVSLDWIYAHYAGDDEPQKIKACIRDYAENRGTLWVALVGDDTLFPVQYCSQFGTGSQTTPCDLYYAAIDDMDWDDDRDGDVGRCDLADTVDLIPDVFLGRLPIRTAADATAIVNKTLAYEKESPSSGFAERMLMAGNRISTYGDDEAICENVYSTCIDPYWNPVRVRLYDSATDFPGGAEYAANGTHLSEQLNTGYNFLYECSHGGATGWALESVGFESSDALALSNTGRYTNILTQACMTNAFHHDDPCLSEAFLRHPSGGAVTYIGSSVITWTSDCIPAAFYRKLFNPDPSVVAPNHVGAILAAAKSSIYAPGELYRYNLMGDPELPLYIYNPQRLTPTVPARCRLGSQILRTSNVLPGATVCFYKPGEVYAYGEADSNGEYTATIVPLTPGSISVTASASGYYPFETTVQAQTESAGQINLSRKQSGQVTSIHVTLSDADLAGHGSQSVVVSTSEGDSELVVLLESATMLGVFEANLPLQSATAQPNNNLIELAASGTVQILYTDADDGTGNLATMQDSLVVDQSPPSIVNVQIRSITSSSATISFQTDTLAAAEIWYGSDCDHRDHRATASVNPTTQHESQLAGLEPEHTYWFTIRALDAFGNEAENDNAGACYSFSTRGFLRVPSQYPTIQVAVDAALTGDTVLLAPGAYTGNGNMNITVFSRDVTIRGEQGRDKTIIDGQKEAFAFAAGGNTLNLEGLTIMCTSPAEPPAAVRTQGSLHIAGCRFHNNNIQGTNFHGAAVFCAGAELHIIASIFDRNMCEQGGAVGALSKRTFIENCIFNENGASWRGGAVHLGNTQAHICHCTFCRNSALEGDDIACSGSTTVNIVNSILWSNRPVTPAGATFSNCDVRNQVAGNNNFTLDPRLTSPDLRCLPDSPCIDRAGPTDLDADLASAPRPLDGNRDDIAVSDIGAYEYDPDSAIIGAPFQLELWATQESASPHAMPLTNAGGQPLHWRASADRDWLVISPTEGWCAPSATVNLTTTPRIEGLSPGRHLCFVTVTGQDGVTPRTLAVYLYLGTVKQVPSQYATIQAAVNAATDGDVIQIAPGTYRGSGNVNVNLQGKRITVMRNGDGVVTLDGQNSARALLLQSGEDKNTIIDGLTIVNCAGLDGGAVLISGASPRIRNCRFSHCTATGLGSLNAMAGAVVCSNGFPELQGCWFRDNNSSSLEEIDGGAVCFQNSGPLLSNCVFAGNRGSLAGALGFYNCWGARVVNCTFTGNSSAYAGAITCDNLEITNSILWGDSGEWAPEVLPCFDQLTVNNSDIAGGPAAMGELATVQWNASIDADPRFVDATEFRLLLKPDSPCRDTGSTAYLPSDLLVDFDGHPRSIGMVDMGAFEFIAPIAGDFDSDGDIDLADFDAFAACAAGPGVAMIAGCEDRDLDHDTDGDSADFAVLQRCYSGATKAADPACE